MPHAPVRRTRHRLLLALLLLAPLAGCGTVARAAFTQPEVRFDSWGVRRMGLADTELEVRLRVINPNGYSLQAERLGYTLFVDSTQVGQGALDSAVTVGARDSAIVAFPVRLGFATLQRVGTRLLRGGEIPYRVAGDVTVRTFAGSFTRRFDQSGRYDPAQAFAPR
ncbi:MAG: LEA type 2 family protein [Gemmatimonadaceae bacterium]|nr:LEA type 2 family protein [Gemmatimonadaceae bacterium]